jgi:hypothetical protein
MNPLCVHCSKPLRKCKRTIPLVVGDEGDGIPLEIHFSCLGKIRKQKWDEDFEKLRLYLETKNIKLL